MKTVEISDWPYCSVSVCWYTNFFSSFFLVFYIMYIYFVFVQTSKFSFDVKAPDYVCNDISLLRVSVCCIFMFIYNLYLSLFR